MDKSLITVVVPTFRRPKLLQRALGSILLGQEGSDPVIQILDNCSQDETLSVINAFKDKSPNIKYHCHSHNIGAVANFCAAFDYVDTEYFSLLSDDDILMPGFFETGLSIFSRYPDAMFVVFRCLYTNEDLSVLSVLSNNLKPGFYHPTNGFEEFLNHGPKTWTSIMFRSSIINSNRLEPTLGASFDMDFIFRLASQYPFFVTDAVGAAYVARDNSYTGSNEFLLLDVEGRSLFYSRILNSYLLPKNVARRTVGSLRRNYNMRLIRMIFANLFHLKHRELAQSLKAILKHNDSPSKLLFVLIQLMTVAQRRALNISGDSKLSQSEINAWSVKLSDWVEELNASNDALFSKLNNT